MPLSLADQIDQACDDFERNWRRQPRMTIDESLKPFAPESQKTVFLELLAVELELRRKDGETPVPADYESQYASFTNEIARAFSGMPAADLSQSRHHDDTSQSPALRAASARRSAPEGAPGAPEGAARDASAELSLTQTYQPEIKKRLGRYGLVELLGTGGFGEVWLAWDAELHRNVAIKMLRADRQVSSDVYERFLEEGRKLALLRHPHIVSIFDMGRDEGQLFLVSEFMDGGTLAARLRNSRFEPEATIRIGIAVAEALHHAHLQGIVHRDVKPANILLGARDEVKLGDFGVAASEVDQLQEDRAAIGTLAYMSPEQIRGDSHHADARSDIYSLGMVLYEMLTGRKPFIAQSVAQLKEQVLTREPRPPRTVCEGIPAALEQIVLKCLSKDIRSRYTTAADLAADLKRCLHVGPHGVWRSAVLVGAWLLPVLALLGIGWYASRPPSRLDSTHSPGQKLPAKDPGGVGQSFESEWALRLGQPPVEIPWPGRRDRHRVSFHDDSRTLELWSGGPLLAKFGTIPATGTWEASLRCARQNDFAGGGFFWGYHEIDDGNELAAYCEVFRLRRHYLGNDRYKWVALRAHIRINPNNGQMQTLGRVAECPIVLPQGYTYSLDLRFRDGKLSSIAFDHVELPALMDLPAPEPAGAAAPRDFNWGGFAEGETFCFGLPEIAHH